MQGFGHKKEGAKYTMCWRGFLRSHSLHNHTPAKLHDQPSNISCILKKNQPVKNEA